MSSPVRIPADIDMADKVLGPLTIRQVVVLGATGLLLYGLWWLTRGLLPLGVYLALAVPVSVVAAALILGQRDGVPLDRLLLAAIRQRLTPRQRVAAPDGLRPAPAWLTQHASTTDTANHRRGGAANRGDLAPLRLPAQAVTDTGVVDLGSDGLAVIGVCSTINFALRTPEEQDALIGAFGRYLHSLNQPAQLVVRTERLDLTGCITDLHQAAPALPHPALEQAALEHADFLGDLAARSDLLCRQVLLVLRQPYRSPDRADRSGSASRLLPQRRRTTSTSPSGRDEGVDRPARHTAEALLARRLSEAAELLGSAGITVTPLDAAQATGVLASACDPDTWLPPGSGLAAADDVITTHATEPEPTDLPGRYFP